MAKHKVAILFVIAIGSIAALVSGGSFLETPLPGGLPVGNILVAGVLCPLAGAAIVLSRPSTVLRYFSIASLVAACAWLPVSIGLAGNLTLNFTGFRGEIWICLSWATNILVLLAVAWATIDHLIRRRLRGGSASDA